MSKPFGQLLKESRRDKGISQRELADAIGVDFSYISKVENDRLPPPAADTIVKICDVLGIPSETFLAQTGKISSDITETISTSAEAIRFLKEAGSMRLSDEEWQTLSSSLKHLR